MVVELFVVRVFEEDGGFVNVVEVETLVIVVEFVVELEPPPGFTDSVVDVTVVPAGSVGGGELCVVFHGAEALDVAEVREIDVVAVTALVVDELSVTTVMGVGVELTSVVTGVVAMVDVSA